MSSMFIVQHEGSVFQLSEEEWKQALNKYPNLDNSNEFINYYERSANSWIEPKKDQYFDNDIIIKQFERLFQLLEFKIDYKGRVGKIKPKFI